MTDAALSENIPPAAGPRVILKPHKGGPFFAHHPWVLDSSIAAVVNRPEDGGDIEVVAENGRWVAHGIWNGASRIRTRLYSWQESQRLDEPFWTARLDAALDLRRQLGLLDPSGACRLVFSEADGLSGLIVDRFGEHLVAQITARAMEQRWPLWQRLLVDRLQPRSLSVCIDPGAARAEGLAPREEIVYRAEGAESNEPLVIQEHGLKFRIDIGEGQKTGFYLDQRDNRKAAAQYMAGRRVLDICCYSGGFSLAASALGQAREVVGVDSSAKVLALARANAEANSLANVRFESGDCFEALAAYAARGETFEAIVLDPPRFAGSRRQVDSALRAYHRLNRLAVNILAPGGFLVSCSCSGHVSREDFLHMLAGVSQKSGRDLQILEQRGASPDHPVRTSCPETEYLKCFICRVM